MATQTTQKLFRYVRAPAGVPDASCFRLEEAPIPSPADGQVLVETHFLSIDPYMRRQMGGSPYRNGLKLGDVMIGRGAGVVVESRHPAFKPGDAVQSEFGWREFVTLDGNGLRKLEPDLQPLSLSLGIVGQSGATAYVGLFDIGHMQPGETVLVSAAAGAVGSAVGQIARLSGCRAIGIAGGAAKCRHVTQNLGFDACLDYKAGPLGAQLSAAAPDGIDIYFDNVGGETLDVALEHMRDQGRVPICGQISQYNTAEKAPLRNVGLLLDKSIMLRGFRIGDHLPRRDFALGELMRWYREGRLKFRETVADDLESAPAALANMLTGGNIGKQVVRVKT